MSDKKKIYISGPITGVDDYLENFKKAECKWKLRGYIVVNPARILKEMPEETTYEEYMEIAMKLLSMCDNIYMMNGWEQSRGANREYGYALADEIEIWKEESK